MYPSPPQYLNRCRSSTPSATGKVLFARQKKHTHNVLGLSSRRFPHPNPQHYTLLTTNRQQIAPSPTGGRSFARSLIPNASSRGVLIWRIILWSRHAVSPVPGGVQRQWVGSIFATASRHACTLHGPWWIGSWLPLVWPEPEYPAVTAAVRKRDTFY